MTLDHIEFLIEKLPQKGIFAKTWERDVNYFRIDGSTSSQQRHFYIEKFNEKSNYL